MQFYGGKRYAVLRIFQAVFEWVYANAGKTSLLLTAIGAQWHGFAGRLTCVVLTIAIADHNKTVFFTKFTFLFTVRRPLSGKSQSNFAAVIGRANIAAPVRS